MNSPEFKTGQDGNRGKGGTIHGFAMKDVGAPPPELPIDKPLGGVVGPTQQEVEDANAGRLAPKGLTKKLIDLSKKWQFRLGLAGLATGAAVYGAYENIPAVHRLIDDRIPGTPIEEKFPIILPKDNFTPVTPEEEQALWKNIKTVDLEKHTFTIGFPVNQETIDKSPNLRMNSYFDQELFIGVPASGVEKIRQEGIDINQQISGLPKDTKIYYHYDFTKFDASIIAIGIAGVKQGEGGNSFTPAYTSFRIILKSKETGKQYASGIDVLYGKPLVAPAPYPEKYHPVYENGTPIKPDEPILQLTTDLQDWDGKTGYPLPGQKGQIVMQGISTNDQIDQRDPNIANLILGVKYLNSLDGNIAIQQ